MTLQPLLPVQHGGAGSPLQTVGLGCRPGSQHASPAKELLVAVRHGDAGGAARAAAAACLTTPVILAAAALMLCATLGLAVYLLPQPPLPGMLAHVRPRGQQSECRVPSYRTSHQGGPGGRGAWASAPPRAGAPAPPTTCLLTNVNAAACILRRCSCHILRQERLLRCTTPALPPPASYVLAECCPSLAPQAPTPSDPFPAAGPRQRTFIEELTQQEQQLISRAAGPPPPTLHRQHRGGAHSLDELALTADQQQQQADQQQQQQQPAEPQQQGGKARQGALPPSADGEPLFNIHTIAGVPQLFGKVAEDREQ